MTIFKNLMEEPSSFMMDFKSPYEVLLRHKYFDLHIVDTMKRRLS